MVGWVLELHLTNEKSKAKVRVKMYPQPLLRIFFGSGKLTSLLVWRVWTDLSHFSLILIQFLSYISPEAIATPPGSWSWPAVSGLESEDLVAAGFLSAFLPCTGFRKTLCVLPSRWCSRTEQLSEGSTFLTFKGILYWFHFPGTSGLNVNILPAKPYSIGWHLMNPGSQKAIMF